MSGGIYDVGLGLRMMASVAGSGSLEAPAVARPDAPIWYDRSYIVPPIQHSPGARARRRKRRAKRSGR